jgi:tRNA threonylcarbamoyladenosine biosynthesis protein TsaE
LIPFVAKTEEDLDEAVSMLLKAAGGERKKIALTGDLGAGKTTFVRAFCRRFKVREQVTSPTFTIANEYSYQDEKGQEHLIYHLDLYRLKNVKEAYDIGITNYLDDENYCLIEWPEIVREMLPENIVWVKISILPDASRKLLFLGFEMK